MKTTLFIIGQTRNKYLEQLLTDYKERILHYLSFDIETLPEPRTSRNLTEEQQKTQEGLQILSRLQPTDRVVLLDERGQEMRSMEYASHLSKLLQGSHRRIVYIIGGPYGFSKEVYARANEMFSLSQMTFSHEMIRLLFLEQLYRALTILRGQPYHHE
jgi:23S rRNA (pseudouridine1915-N3)-methyltransferase